MGRNDEIRRIAYGIWEREGRLDGHALEHWQKAEKNWTSQHTTPSHSDLATEPKGPSVANAPRTPSRGGSTRWVS